MRARDPSKIDTLACLPLKNHQQIAGYRACAATPERAATFRLAPPAVARGHPQGGVAPERPSIYDFRLRSRGSA